VHFVMGCSEESDLGVWRSVGLIHLWVLLVVFPPLSASAEASQLLLCAEIDVLRHLPLFVMSLTSWS